MATNKQYARKVDYEKSTLWALSSMASLGVGPVGVNLFHLVNRNTHRGHRFELITLGGGESLLPVTGSVEASDYVNFNTLLPVNFFDFDGLVMKVSEINIGLYSWTEIQFPSWGTKLTISDGGVGVPALGESMGMLQILFGDGQILGSVDDLQIKPPVDIYERPKPFKNMSQDDALTYLLPGDLLFATDKHHLKPGKRTDEALERVANQMNYAKEDFRFLVVGHTDNKGTADYNMGLSRRRAETVGNWLKQHTRQPNWIKTLGVGLTEPIKSNADEYGRQQNRRVEVVVMRKQYWDSW